VKKMMQHQGQQGVGTFEAQYDDSPKAQELGALLMGRTPEKVNAVKSFASTAAPDLAKYRVPSDVPRDDPIYIRLVASDRERCALESVAVSARALLKEKQLSSGAKDAGVVALRKAN